MLQVSLEAPQEVSAVQSHVALLGSRQLLLEGGIVPSHVVGVQRRQLLFGEVANEAALLYNTSVDIFPLLLEVRIGANIADARARATALADLRQRGLAALCVMLIF